MNRYIVYSLVFLGLAGSGYYASQRLETTTDPAIDGLVRVRVTFYIEPPTDRNWQTGYIAAAQYSSAAPEPSEKEKGLSYNPNGSRYVTVDLNLSPSSAASIVSRPYTNFKVEDVNNPISVVPIP